MPAEGTTPRSTTAATAPPSTHPTPLRRLPGLIRGKHFCQDPGERWDPRGGGGGPPGAVHGTWALPAAGRGLVRWPRSTAAVDSTVAEDVGAVASGERLGGCVRRPAVRPGPGLKSAAALESGSGLVDEDGPVTKDELAAWWRWFAEHECRGYSPLHEKVCFAVADTDALLDRLLVLPGHAQQPNMLLAAAHELVLRGGAPSLAACYDPNLLDQVGDRFVSVVTAEWPTLVPILEQRRTQTNEIGRVAVLAPALAAVAADRSVTVVDVGTSASLTLQLDRCFIELRIRVNPSACATGRRFRSH